MTSETNPSRIENLMVLSPSNKDYDIDFRPNGEKSLMDEAITWATKVLRKGAIKAEFDVTDGGEWFHVEVTK